MQFILAFMLCAVRSGTRILILFHEALKGPSCNQRKLVNETVNGEIYGSSS
jgi:hypothetical protein